SQRPEFSDGQELIDISSEAKIDHAASSIECDSAGFEGAQIFKRHRQDVSEFLRLGAGGVMNHPTVGWSEWSAEAFCGQTGNGGVEAGNPVSSRQRTCAAHGRGADRVKTEPYIGGLGCVAALLDDRGEQARRVLNVRA